MSTKSKHDRLAAQQERACRVQRGIYALGMAVLPDHMVPAMRTALDEMEGMDWIDIPYSMARSLYDTIELYVIRKNIRTGGMKLIELDPMAGVLKMTTFGDLVLKKLGDRLRLREGLGVVRT